MKDNQNSTLHLQWFGIPNLLPYLKPYRKQILFMVLLGALGSIIDICIPLFQRYAIDNFISRQKTNGIGVFVVLYAFVLFLQILANYRCFHNAGKVEMYVGRDLKRISFNHLQTLSFSYFSQNLTFNL